MAAARPDGEELERWAAAYRDAVHAASRAGVEADPEAQLTNPFDVLLTKVARRDGLGRLRLIREQQMQSSKPDFGVLRDGRFCGWIELKKPDTALDSPGTWTGHNGRQWEQLSYLDNLLLSNGREVRLFRVGEQVGDTALLPYEHRPWDAGGLSKLVRQFAESHVAPITAVSVLATRLAPLARELRDRIRAQADRNEVGSAAVERAHEAWCAYFQEDADLDQFADAVSQVVTYGLVIAALEGAADRNEDGFVSLAEARDALQGHHRLLSAALAPVMEVKGFLATIELEVGAIERLVSAVDVVTVHSRKDRRGEPWLWFYEDFLAAYDPIARKKAGVYYTPLEVVKCITHLVDDVLVERFGMSKGFGDQRVTTLDPACGTGTFPLAVTDLAAERMLRERGPAGPAQAATTLGDSLFGFELLPGPYAVAHLRLTQRLKELGGELPENGVNILLTDTLASPHDDTGPQLALFGDAEILAEERRHAQRVQRDHPVMVILGNPPYRRTDKDSAGGWILHGDSRTPDEKAPFASVVKRANEHTIFSHRRSLYNLYTYFWRWAIWKAFEANGPGPGVVAFITGSRWLSGQGFVGLRELALKHADEVLALDLGGDNKGARRDENVFAIESPVAIVLLIRDGRSDGRRKARIRYRRIDGAAAEKLAQLDQIRSVEGTEWQEVKPNPDSSFVPESGGPGWARLPAITQLFPWQQPGCILSRLWPVAPDPAVLETRWRELLTDGDEEVRAEKFATAKTGRNIKSSVHGLPRLADLPADAPVPPIGRYGWRSFDRQWVLEDPRIAKTESPSLWQSRSASQIFLAVPSKVAIGAGPSATVTCDVPDFHFVFGRNGGKDILPLFRDAAGAQPNVTDGLLDALGSRLELQEAPSAQELMAYVYAILSTPAFQENFEDELRTPGVRVPITVQSSLWQRAVAIGERLLWLHTFGQRCQSPGDGRGVKIPHVDGLGWEIPVSSLPVTLKEVQFDTGKNTIAIGDGLVSGVRPEVWGFSVSGLEVVKKWIGYRTQKGIGNAASKPKPLDRIRPRSWLDSWNDELLDLLRVLTLTVDQRPEQDALLMEIMKGPLVGARELPEPLKAATLVPETLPWGERSGRLSLSV